MPIARSLATVHARIAAACAASGRPVGGVELLAVSKTFGVDAVREAMDAGQRAFGESYVQEALGKIAAVPQADWHFIGPLQGNKTAEVAAHFSWVHSLDREKIARRLSEQRPAGMAPLNVCVQVNISGEATKSGVVSGDAAGLCRSIVALPRLRLRGLMAIPAAVTKRDSPHFREDENGDSPFRALRELFDSLRREGFELDTLSAGMSDDLEAAIAEGSTLVRVGTAIFGQRSPTKDP
ncbi:MAG TPA: YggS family pyridoxal phosphate-dependent enzyme [Verrucomicrobiae bacterium]|nr:YggS family pyridoxal phosphate-dependent enzyme [Verrucomicrobiae bacterium]